MARNSSEIVPVAQGGTHLILHASNEEESLAFVAPWNQKLLNLCVTSWRSFDRMKKDNASVIQIVHAFTDFEAFSLCREVEEWLATSGLEDLFWDGMAVCKTPPPTSDWTKHELYGQRMIITESFASLSACDFHLPGNFDADGFSQFDQELIGRLREPQS